MSLFWTNFASFSHNHSIKASYIPLKVLKPLQNQKKTGWSTDEMNDSLSGTGIKHVEGLNFFCERCHKKLVIDCPMKISRHVETKKHKDGLPGLLLAYLDTFEFPDFKKSKRSHDSNTGYSTLYKTVKSKKQIRESFSEFIKKDKIERVQFDKIIRKCGIHFTKMDSFFCLCPVCQVPDSKDKDSAAYERHRTLVKDR